MLYKYITYVRLQKLILSSIAFQIRLRGVNDSVNTRMLQQSVRQISNVRVAWNQTCESGQHTTQMFTKC